VDDVEELPTLLRRTAWSFILVRVKPKKKNISATALFVKQTMRLRNAQLLPFDFHQYSLEGPGSVYYRSVSGR
jgi:hypothetical protein